MGIYYLGAFPPSFGGVTVKNQNLYQALSAQIEIEKIDFNLIKKKNIREIIRLVRVIIGRNNRFVIGVSGKQTRKRFTQLLYYINRKAMNHSLIFLMGGTAANDIASDPEYLKCASGYKMIYAETQGMIKTLEDAGLHNAGYYPNGRFKPKHQVEVREKDGRLKCVFFSLIQPEKGADIILEAASLLPEVEFSFYGNIDQRYRQAFEEKVDRLGNVKYHGIFKGSSEEVYAELRKYDVLLFTTKWEIEGVPGILVEGKIAGLAEVVSNKSYNAELVQDNKEGIVLHENSVAGLVEALTSLDQDNQTLLRLKKGSFNSAEHYYIENNIGAVIDEISVGGGYHADSRNASGSF